MPGQRRSQRGSSATEPTIQIKGSRLEGAGNLADKFRNAVNAKTERQDRLDKLDLAFRKASEKKKIEVQKFKNDIAAMLADDSDDDEKIRASVRKRNEKQGPKKPGSLKGKWEEEAQKSKELEQQKIERERKRNEKRDRDLRKAEKKRIQEKAKAEGGS